jgi:hypothetical protein
VEVANCIGIRRSLRADEGQLGNKRLPQRLFLAKLTQRRMVLSGEKRGAFVLEFPAIGENGGVR